MEIIDNIRFAVKKIKNNLMLKKYGITKEILHRLQNNFNLIQINEDSGQTIVKSHGYYVEDKTNFYVVYEFADTPDFYHVFITNDIMTKNIYGVEIRKFYYRYYFGFKVIDKDKILIIPRHEYVSKLVTEEEKYYFIDDYELFLDAVEITNKYYIVNLCYVIQIEPEIIEKIDLFVSDKKQFAKNVCALCYLIKDEIIEIFNDKDLEDYLEKYFLTYDFFVYNFKSKTKTEPGKVYTLEELYEIVNNFIKKYPDKFFYSGYVDLVHTLGCYYGNIPLFALSYSDFCTNPAIFDRLQKKNNKKLVKKLRQRFDEYHANFLKKYQELSNKELNATD